MANTIDQFLSNSLGRLFFRTVQPFVHAARRMNNPDTPTDQKVARVSYGDRNFSIRHRRWSAADTDAIKQCFEQKQYDMPTREQGAFIQSTYEEIVASGRQPLIIDCGANIGASVLWFLARYPQAHVVGIEPAPSNFELLTSNCTGFDVDLRLQAIGAEDGISFLNDTGTDMAYRVGTSNKGQMVRITSIATLLASKQTSLYTPFLLKIDIEGSEKNLFSGDCSAINRFPLIILEPHDWLYPGELCSQEFFRFHVAAGREFCMHDENVGSIDYGAIAESTAMGINHP